MVKNQKNKFDLRCISSVQKIENREINSVNDVSDVPSLSKRLFKGRSRAENMPELYRESSSI